MLRRRVSLHDVNDVEAFVVACIKRSGANAPPEDWEELIAEGILLLYTMANNYKPRLEGYAKDGCFSGYAIKWLPKQIHQAWHKSQEHHLYVKDKETGKRGWVYRITPVSYEVAVLDVTGTGSHQEVKMVGINQFVEVPVWTD